MSINSNNPITWNRPKWENNSCYANASLWGLLYNDIFIDLIKNTETKNENEDKNFQNKTIKADIINNNRTTIKENLIDFHDSIQNTNDKKTPEEVYSYTRNIRESLTNISNSDWNEITADPQEFLSIISEQFDDINVCNGGKTNTPENKFLPIINLPQNSVVTNKIPKTISIETNDDINECKFSQDTNGLIVQYGGPGAQIPEKFYSIGQYKLYAFLHYINEGHYACYFEFNDNWYIFDDLENNRNGSIVSVDLTKNVSKIIREECYLFFYKIDVSLKLGENVLFSAKFKFQKEAINQQSKPILKSQIKSLEEEPEVFTSPIQKINKCEQYGNDWLNLFITEPGTTITKTKTKTGQEIVSVEKDGVTLTRVAVPENCTFVEPQQKISSLVSPIQDLSTQVSQPDSSSQSISRSSSGETITSQDIYSESEINGNLMNVNGGNPDLKKVYDTKLVINNTANTKPIPIYVVFKENNIEEKFLHPDGNICDSSESDSEKSTKCYTKKNTLYKKITGIFFNKDDADEFIKSIRKVEGGTRKRKAMNYKITIKNIKNKLRRTKKHIINKRKTRKI